MTRTVLAIRHVPFEDLGLLEPLLVQRGFNIEYCDVGRESMASERAKQPDLLVVLGGPIGVYDVERYPFLVAEREMISARLSAGKPTLGICLGAQLIADVLGADVSAMGQVEIGYAPLTLTADGAASVLAPLRNVPVLHWHGDQFEIPDGAARLAETAGFPNQAFAYGNHILGLQFHLEADYTCIENWLIGHAHELAANDINPGQIRDDAMRYGPALAEAGSKAFNLWLDAQHGQRGL